MFLFAPLAAPVKLPREFWIYSIFTAMTMLGFATFGVLSFHMVEQDILRTPFVPVLYAGAMAVDAGAAVLTGWVYDRFGGKVLLALPVIIGALLWGAAMGIQESTLRATVADMIPPDRRSTAYGAFAAVVGVATAGGGALAGGLYDISIPALIVTTVLIQLLAVIVFLTFTTTKKSRS